MLPHSVSIDESLLRVSAVEAACRRIPPLWPLQNFVAVNPFLGMGEMRFEQAARLLGRVAHRTPLMDAGYYLRQMQAGNISSRDVRAALARCGSEADPADPFAWLSELLQRSDREERILTVADWLDRSRGTGWSGFVVDEVSKFCSSYFDRGQCSWKMPWRNLTLYAAWKRFAAIDANAEVFGLRGLRQYVRELPDSEDAAIDAALDLLDIPGEFAEEFSHRELMSVFGWSAYAAYQDRQGWHSQGSMVRQLLAIRLAYDSALFALDRRWRCQAAYEVTTDGFTEAKYIAQLAAEHAYRSNLVAKLHRGPSPLRETRKALQAVFCIDVRSEVYRRALESQSADIETIGFAGFFGMAIEAGSSARCPVLIAPRYRVHVEADDAGVSRLSRRVESVWKTLRTSVSACFSAVEAGGAWFGVRLLQQTTRTSNTPEPVENLTWRISLPEGVDLVAGALKNMSLEASRLAPVVLICGHGSATENNAYGSSLDCGACGGHKGDINARLATALMNDPAIREGLRARGIAIPADTVFVAGLHITTTDEVILYDSDYPLAEKERLELEGWLQCASRRARSERSPALAADPPFESSARLDREVFRRSADWSEVRPEWGLAGNAAFIAAPRSRTLGLDLGGRVFLHEYDPIADQDGSVLALILTAPVIVASWINLQYFGSTVSNQLFGSGNKVLHNVVGTFGVWEGNGGDLRAGLPLQSLHDGEKWMHEPLRLQVFIEAPRERIDQVLRSNTDIRNLVENSWIHLLAIEGNAIYECRRVAQWLQSGRESN